METPAGAIYHVARDGQVIGAFSLPILAAKFKDGSVKASDHYLIEGTSDWKLVSDLKPQFAALERQLKAEADRKAAEAKAAKEAEAAKAKAAKEETERLRREKQAAENARAIEQQRKARTWKCHICDSEFLADGRTPPADNEQSIWSVMTAKGLRLVIWLVVISVLLGAMAISALFFARGEGKILLVLLFALGSFIALTAAVGQLIAYGVETATRRFHSQRRRCPNCSSPYCSKQPD